MFASLNIILHCHGYASIIHSLFTSKFNVLFNISKRIKFNWNKSVREGFTHNTPHYMSWLLVIYIRAGFHNQEFTIEGLMEDWRYLLDEISSKLN